MVQINGRVSNTGSIPICGITVEIDEEENAWEKWPGWYPTYVKPLKPYKSLNFGASIPMKSGTPSAALIDWYNCESDEVTDDDYFFNGKGKAHKKGKAQGVVKDGAGDYVYDPNDQYYYAADDSSSYYYQDDSGSQYYYDDSASYSGSSSSYAGEPVVDDYYRRGLRN